MSGKNILGSALFEQGRSGNRKQTIFFFGLRRQELPDTIDVRSKNIVNGPSLYQGSYEYHTYPQVYLRSQTDCSHRTQFRRPLYNQAHPGTHTNQATLGSTLTDHSWFLKHQQAPLGYQHYSTTPS